MKTRKIQTRLRHPHRATAIINAISILQTIDDQRQRSWQRLTVKIGVASVRRRPRWKGQCGVGIAPVTLIG